MPPVIIRKGRECYTVGQAAQCLGVSRRTMMRWVKTNRRIDGHRLETFFSGSQKYISVRSVKRIQEARNARIVESTTLSDMSPETSVRQKSIKEWLWSIVVHFFGE